MKKITTKDMFLLEICDLTEASAEDRLRMLLRSETLGEERLAAVLDRIADRAISSNNALHCGIPVIEWYAEAWSDRTTDTAWNAWKFWYAGDANFAAAEAAGYAALVAGDAAAAAAAARNASKSALVAAAEAAEAAERELQLQDVRYVLKLNP